MATPPAPSSAPSASPTSNWRPVEPTTKNLAFVLVGTALGYGAGSIAPGMLKIVVFLVLLAIPFHAIRESRPTGWSFFVGSVWGSLMAVERWVEKANITINKELPGAISLLLILLLLSSTAGYLIGQNVKDVSIKPLPELLKEWAATFAFSISVVVTGITFVSGVEVARAWSSRLTTVVVSLGMVVFLGLRMGLYISERMRRLDELP